jgi:hypothetical protein
MIYNGNITASSSSQASGIGTGFGGSGGISFVETLSVLGGNMTANGTLAGIGSGGEGGEVQKLKFSGNAVLTCDAIATKFPVNASSIVFSNGSFLFVTPRDRLFGVSPTSSDLLNLVIVYGDVTNEESEPLSKLNATLVQIGNVTSPHLNDWMVCVSGDGYEDCHETGSPVVQSLIVSVPPAGNYLVKMSSNGTSGFLEREEGVSTFTVASNHSFVSEARFVPFATQTPTSRLTFSPQFDFFPMRVLLREVGYFVAWDFS